MTRSRRPFSAIEILEARYAPALVVANPLPDITAAAGSAKMFVELGQLLDSSIENPNHTFLTFTTNLDSDPVAPGIQPSVFVMELFDDEAPLTVQNFLRYVQSPDGAQNFAGTFFHRSVPGFVIQGGGFDDVAPQTHIPTFANVHNEFDPARSNLRGTVAMAKTGLGPHTATSEWFVNLADNSANLDEQNGGFTVFARITGDTLPVFDAIAALPTANFGGALTSLPVQNYNSDPDGNPFTPPPEPTGRQLVKITDIQVAPPQPGNTAGLAYSVVSVNDAGTTTPSNIVTTKIKGSQLVLKYTRGASGVADVTVRVTNGAEDALDTFSLVLRPNLTANFNNDGLETILVPGDTMTSKVKIANTGAGAISTTVDVKYYLSAVGGDDPNGTIIGEDDLLVGQLLGQPISLEGGGKTALSAQVSIPRTLVTDPDTIYRLIASVEQAAGSTAAELFTDDNAAIDGGQHVIKNEFGSITVSGAGTRVVPKLVFEDPNGGGRVVLKLIGGRGEIIPNGGVFDVDVTNTGGASTLKIKSAGATLFNDIEVAGSLGFADFRGADIAGNLAFSGGISKLRTGDLSGDNLLIIGLHSNPAATANIKVGDVTDYSIESDMPIFSLKAKSWVDAGGRDDTIFVRSLKNLTIAGDFQANVSIGTNARVSSVFIGGTFSDATFSALRADVGSVMIGAMRNAGFFLGAESRPDSIEDFAQTGRIGSFLVGGQGIAGSAFIDSQIAAARIGSLIVGGVGTTADPGPFGVVADKIGSYTRSGQVALGGLKQPGVFDPLPGAGTPVYSVTIL